MMTAYNVIPDFFNIKHWLDKQNKFCLLHNNIYQQSQNISGLMENEVYVFAVTAVNQVGESMVNATTMIQTNESSELS